VTTHPAPPGSGSFPAGRGTRLPRLARRAQLLAAAEEVFVARGYHAAGMDEIAARAGVSKPVLYQHFPGKLELYLALLDQSAADLVARIHQALESTHDNRQRVEATMRTYFDFVDDPAASHQLLFENDLMSEPAVLRRLATVTRDCAEAISQIIEEDTGLPRDEARLLAVGLAGMAQVSARYWLRSDRTVSREAAVLLASTLGWRGLRGFPLRDEPDQHPASPPPPDRHPAGPPSPQ
jgi:AcrR family transcriptional regulator